MLSAWDAIAAGLSCGLVGLLIGVMLGIAIQANAPPSEAIEP